MKTLKAEDYSDLLKTSYSDAFAFSDQEQLVLDLYDQLHELELQESLLLIQDDDAYLEDVSTLSDDAVQEQLIKAEREAMDARAEYELRNRLTENSLTMDPVLKAVHGGEHTDYAEKRLLPLVHDKSIVSMVHSSLASELIAATKALCKAEEGNIGANARNQELAQTLIKLAERAKTQSIEDVNDPGLRDEIREVERSVKKSRARLRTLKGILSGMIVGSGIDWTEDEALRDLIMDDEEDG